MAHPAGDPSEAVERALAEPSRRRRIVSIRRRGRGAPPGTPRLSMPPPGTAGGIEAEEFSAVRAPGAEPVLVTCVDYSLEECAFEEIGDIPDFLARHRPDWSRVRWINIEGLGRLDILRAFAEKYQLHPLAVEDVLHRVQTPKAEDYPGSADQPGRLFVVAREIEEDEGSIRSEQVSLFLGRSTLLTFHAGHRGELEAIRQRIRTPGSRLRQNDVSFLLYVLLDGIVDRFFPLLERYSERLEALEEALLEGPGNDTLQQIHQVKRELLLVRRAAWPLRELVSQLQRDRHECLSDNAQTYLRDVHDHCMQIIDLIETYREIASGLAETYVSVMSNRTNEVMKVLTVIGTVFLPLTFLAGVYGMNMPIPENGWNMTYPAFWIVCVLVAATMLLYFRRRGWL